MFALHEILVATKLCSSNSEAIRKVKEGAVKVDGVKVSDAKLKFDFNSRFTVGKREAVIERRLNRPVLTMEMCKHLTAPFPPETNLLAD